MTKLIRNNQKGFTLIELMIVVAIIGILAAIAIPQFSAYRERAFIASMNADLNSVKLGEEAYYVDNETYIVIAAGVTDTSAIIPGGTVLSSGNSVQVTAGTVGIATDYIIIVKSSKTSAVITYTSSTGQTVQS